MVTADPALISHSPLRCGNVLHLIFVAIKMCFSFVVLIGCLRTFPAWTNVTIPSWLLAQTVGKLSGGDSLKSC